jgi:hypothetical protein
MAVLEDWRSAGRGGVAGCRDGGPETLSMLRAPRELSSTSSFERHVSTPIIVTVFLSDGGVWLSSLDVVVFSSGLVPLRVWVWSREFVVVVWFRLSSR